MQEIGLPPAREAGTFDIRAWKIWDYVARSVQYITDKQSFGLEDFWLFPEETLMLHKGDCEDSSFLLATLLLASGVSEQCVRVVLGRVASPEGAYGHAWVVYQNEAGQWCLLESTLDCVPSALVPADPFTMPGNQYQYQPQFCLNASHLWSMAPIRTKMADYLKMRAEPTRRRPFIDCQRSDLLAAYLHLFGSGSYPASCPSSSSDLLPSRASCRPEHSHSSPVRI